MESGKPLHSFVSRLDLTEDPNSGTTGGPIRLGGFDFGPESAIPVRRRAQRSGVRNHARYLLVVAIRNEHGLTELALRLWPLRSKDVPRLRLSPLDFAGASFAEALGRARMGLQLGHFLLFVPWSGPNLAWLLWRGALEAGVSPPS